MSWIAIFYSLSVYMLTTLWYNVQSYLVEHHIYVLAYFVVVGGLSFAVCYRMVSKRRHFSSAYIFVKF